MATYRIGPAGHYRSGIRYYHGETIVLANDEKPSRTFEPLDKEAKAAFKKHFPTVKPESTPLPEEKDETPRTMSEMNGAVRASDREIA